MSWIMCMNRFSSKVQVSWIVIQLLIINCYQGALLVSSLTTISSSAGTNSKSPSLLFPRRTSSSPYENGSNFDKRNGGRRIHALHNTSYKNPSDYEPQHQKSLSFDSIVESRYACTRFQRQDGTSSSANETHGIASTSNPKVVNEALQCLDLSRRAPSGFNAQPYRLLMISEKSVKEQVAKFCLGRNADRVRDSDCTILFLADRECLREYKRFGKFLDASSTTARSLSKWSKRKMQFFILLFSSGWPLPRILSNPLSFALRLAVSTLSAITRRKILVPSLGSAETWASKNTMLVAMTYMLACSSRGLATCPMEGFNVGGMRKVLNIPRRYAIPLIVSTGLPYQREVEEEGFDDVGMGHGPKVQHDGSSSNNSSKRYPMEEVIFTNDFGIRSEI